MIGRGAPRLPSPGPRAVLAACALLAALPCRHALADKAMAPFELSDLAGKRFASTERMAGKVSLVVFWRPGQEQSQRALSDLAAIAGSYDAGKVAFVGIVRGDGDAAPIEQAVGDAHVTFPILRDRDDAVYGSFGVIVAPTTFFVDAAGTIRFKYPGYRHDYRANVRADLDRLLGVITAKQRDVRTTNRPAPSWKGLAGGEARLVLAHKLLRKGRRAEAIAQLQRAWGSKPPVADAAVELGMLALEDRRDEDALRWFRRALKLAPHDPRARAGKGVAMMRTGQKRAGLRVVLAVLTKHELDEPLLYYEAGVACQDRGRVRAAARYFRRGLELVLARHGAGR